MRRTSPVFSRTRLEVHVLCGDQTRPSVGVLGWHSGMVFILSRLCREFLQGADCRQIFLFLRLIRCFPTAVGPSILSNHAMAMFAYSVI